MGYGMASSAACECGTEEQTVDHVVFQCPIHRPPHGLHGLTVLDDETTEWLLNTCPEFQGGQPVDKRRTRSKERRSSPEETFHVRSTDMSITPNKSMSCYTQYLLSGQVASLERGKPIGHVLNEIINTT